MNIRLLLASALVGAISLTAAAQNPWLHIYRSDKRFHTVPLDSVTSLDIKPDAGFDAATQFILNISGQEPVTVPVAAFDHMSVAPTVPSIYLTTEDADFKDVYDKTTEWAATMRVESNGFPGMEDIEAQELKLRGRGNSTLGMPKKPYRLKAKKKFALHSSLKPAKNYVLLANYIDNTLMRNSVAFKVAQLLDLPYTPNGVPCNVWINGIYRGSYLLCEKTGLNSGHIDDIEETEGVLLELDTNVDPSDTYFETEYGSKELEPFGFPVAVKDPDFKELQEDGEIASADSAINAWKAKYLDLAYSLGGKSETDWTELADLESAVRYIMTFHFCGNLELRHPKSTFIHARNYNSKFEFGHIWDFDWAFTYGDAGEATQQPDAMPFGGANSNLAGSRFFRRIISDERFQKRFGEVWEEFRTTKLPELMQWFDEYAETIEPTAGLNGEMWGQSPQYFRSSVWRLRDWIGKRAEFISTAPNFGLYDERPDQDVTVVPEGYTLAPITAEMVTASDPDPEEGVVENLFDDDPATIYHSDWHSIERHDTVYGSYLDIALPGEATSVVFDLTSRMKLSDGTYQGMPDEVCVYASSDGENWTPIRTVKGLYKDYFNMECGKTIRIGEFISSTPFTHVRFAVTYSAKGSLLHNVIPEFKDVPEFIIPWLQEEFKCYWNLAELRVYTK